MTTISQSLAEWLLKQDPLLQKKVTDKIMIYLNIADRRFWFPQTHLIQTMQQAKDWKEAFALLIELLNAEKLTGYDIISVPYLAVKISLALDANKESVFDPVMPAILEPLPNWTESETQTWLQENKACKAANDVRLWSPIPWMRSANQNYSTMIYRERGIEEPSPGNKTLAKASGITLAYQPVVAPHDWMVASERPSNKNRPKLHQPSQSLDLALQHGLPWGVGVSNSTSIMLHLAHHVKQSGVEVDFEKVLLGTMAFLVHDGGHSVHEALWTTNQINDMLGLGFKLSEEKNPRLFVSDYQKFAELLSPETGDFVKDALSKAMDDVVAYFNKYSHFSTASD